MSIIWNKKESPQEDNILWNEEPKELETEKLDNLPDNEEVADFLDISSIVQDASPKNTKTSTPDVVDYWNMAPSTLEKRQEAFKRVYRQNIKEEPKIPEGYKEPTGFFGQFGEAVQRGYINSKANLGYGIEAIGQMLGSPDFTNFGQQIGDEATVKLIKRPELEPPKDMKSFFQGGFADPDWYARTIGETLPFMGSVIGASTLGGLVGGPAGAAGVGAATAGITSAGALESGSFYKRMIMDGEDPGKASVISNIYGAIAGTIENAFGISPARVGTRFTSKGAMRIMADSYKGFLKQELRRVPLQTLKQAGAEGGEEVAQSLTRNIMNKWVDKEGKIITKEMANEFAAGAVASLPFGFTNIRIPKFGDFQIDEETADQKREQINEMAENIKEPKKKPDAPKYPSDEYKRTLLGEIGEMEDIPEIEKDAWDWKPPRGGYQNPYTKLMYKMLDKAGEVWDSKGPESAKIGSTRKIGELIKERNRVYSGLVKRYNEDLVKPAEKLSDKEKKRVGDMIFKRIDIPDEYQPTVRNIDRNIGQLGQKIVETDKDLINQGLLEEEDALLTEDKWMENLGGYARTIYIRTGEEGEYTLEPRSSISEKGTVDRSAFKRKLTDEEWGANALKFEGASEEQIEQYSLEELREIGQDAKENWGWTTQADYILARTFKDMAGVYATRQYQKAIAEDPELFSKEPKDGFISVESILPRGQTRDVRLGPLNNGYIHKGLENEIETLITKKEDRLSIFQEPLSWWKAFKVAGNIATVVRNFISGGMIQTDMGGYPVWTPKNVNTYRKALVDYLKKGKNYKKLRNQGLYGADYHRVELSDAELDRVIKKVEKSKNPMKTYGKELIDKLAITQDKIRGGLFSYYGHIDHLQRTYMAMAAIKDGASIAQAVNFANKWQLNYRIVPKMIEKMRGGIGGWILPFISFYALMAPRIAEVAVTRPWTLLKYPIAVSALNYLGMTTLGADEEEIEVAKPDFLKEEDYTVTLPWKDEKGNYQFLNLDYTLPFGGPSSGFMDWAQIANFLRSPGLVGITTGIFNNYDLFRGKKIFSETDPPPVKRRKMLSYAVEQLGPGSIVHVKNIINAASGNIEGFPIEKEKNLAQTVARGLGVSTYSGGFNEAWWKMRTLENEIQDIEFAISDIMRNKNISHEKKRERIRQYIEGIKRRRKELMRIGENFPRQTPESTEKTEKGGIIWK